MPFWKPILLIVPAGLLAGTMAGEAIRPVPLVKEERPWPISVREKASAIEPWRPIYEGGPQDLNPGPSRYRPDLDYDVFAWPDRSDRSADYLAELGDVRSDRAVLQASHVSLAAPDLPQTERAVAELAEGRTNSAAEMAPLPAKASPPSSEAVVLPAVPPLPAADLALRPEPVAANVAITVAGGG